MNTVLQKDGRKILYIEPFSGISGDMMIGAFLDLGLSFEELQSKLELLPLEGYRISSQKCMRSGIHATKFDVAIGHAHSHRGFTDIRKMIESSGLSPWVKEKSVKAFRMLAEAESKIHGQPMEKVHFHEVGAVDSIIDIVGSMIAMESFLPADIVASSVNVGHGTLKCRHGTYPVPGPAAQELLKDIPTFTNDAPGELTTPTGATLLATLATDFGTRPAMRIQATGYGAGTRQTEGNANVLRISYGEAMETATHAPVSPEHQVAVIEATIDDMSPQVYGYFLEKAMAAGALDIYSTPIQMKKNRPGLKMTCVCAVAEVDRFTELVFRETTTIGIRYTIAERKTLERKFVPVETSYGMVTMKISLMDGRIINYAPEFEDCRRLASEKDVALKEVQAAALNAYLNNRQ
ncbi:MAG: nickel pincer cofactor biosynthesis protein LarC [Acidobacteria bacterium]|nr:nickel pincer cofactor biosynthesis protein LarC [Acidobacteriota bacterium]